MVRAWPVIIDRLTEEKLVPLFTRSDNAVLGDRHFA